jgi:L-aspartate oxidase
LRNEDGARFMLDEHPQAELAPRDVVARGIYRQLIRNPGGNVYLDLRSLDPGAVVERFPTIAQELQKRGLNLAHDLIPVAPAAHYFMGGLAASAEGRTSIDGLLALGEASCTGVHGANRLASNSLLEGLVFGALSAGRVARDYAPISSEPEQSTRGIATSHGDESLAIALRQAVRETMSDKVGVERDATGLSRAIDMLLQFANQAEELPLTRSGLESRNLLTSATAIATAALHRQESRGAQFRSDFPTIDPALDGRHSLHDPIDQKWRYGSLAEAWEGATLGSRIG